MRLSGASLCLAVVLACVGTAHAQLVASRSFTEDVLNSQVTLVTLAGAGTAVGAGVTTTGTLACTTTYPQITFYALRGSSHLSLVTITTSNSTNWATYNLSFNGLLASDV